MKDDYQKKLPGTPNKPKRMMARRTFIGLGGAAALVALFGWRNAWGGVGGGAWGAYGGEAYPGSHFGYDAGWSYSYDGCVWLSASCNCTVGRMTELFMEVSVDAYVACGGIWYPTWSSDIPDTPTYAYIRNDQGIWLASAYWIIDTTYDHDYYERMTGAYLRVTRQEINWRCWCGADIKGLGGNAPGTHSIAEAPQLVPHHVLSDDRSWHGKIVTLQPRVAEHLFAGVPGVHISSGSNVAAWSVSHMTDQHWVVLESAQGRSRLVCVRTGLAPLALDVSGGVWDDGANLQLWVDNSSAAQSYWVHSLGEGYYLLVPECSGCGVDLYAGGQADGTNIVQWNCYNNWGNVNQNWKLSEPLFRERDNATMTVSGNPELGGVLLPADPGEVCIPYNYPGTAGMYYRYTWYRGSEEGSLFQVAQAASEQASYGVTESDEGVYLTCVVKAYARFGDVPYKGEVVAPSVFVRPSKVTVSFFADDDTEPCLQVTERRGQPFEVPQQARSAAAKPDCAGIDGWYRDREGTVLFEGGAVLEEDISLFARNWVTLEYGMAERSCLVASSRSFFLDEALAMPLSDRSEVLPSSKTQFYGTRVLFSRGPSVWFEDMGRTREASCAEGAYAEAAASGSLLRVARLVRNTTVYLLWRIPAYDGIALS